MAIVWPRRADPPTPLVAHNPNPNPNPKLLRTFQLSCEQDQAAAYYLVVAIYLTMALLTMRRSPLTRTKWTLASRTDKGVHAVRTLTHSSCIL